MIAQYTRKTILTVEKVEEGTYFKNWANAHAGASTIQTPNWTIDDTAGTVSVGAMYTRRGHMLDWRELSG